MVTGRKTLNVAFQMDGFPISNGVYLARDYVNG